MTRRSLLAVPPVLAATLMFAATPAAVTAATSPQTANINVSAGVVDQCVVSGGAGSGLPMALLDFGSRDALATGAAAAQSPSGGSGALQVVCNSTTVTATLALSAGAHGGGGTLRRMSGPGGPGAVLVDYALYRDSARTQFVDTAPFALPNLASGVPYVLVLHGHLPVPSQASAQGNYSDAVSITLSY